VQVAIGDLYRMVDPGRGAIRRTFRAERQHLREGAVGGDAEAVAPDDPGQRAGQMKAVERQDRAPFGFDPVDVIRIAVIRIAVIRHREYANGISLQQDERVDHHSRAR
jgi:hypothetical protein